MYSNLVSIQILISLLKKHNVRHIVISAGQSNYSFARSVEHDDFFRCYSVVDERSAAFFAIGLQLEINEPIAISCTASTACCNYISAITEAYYREIPIVVLTSNYDIRRVDQMRLLSIHQEGMFRDICKKEVQLPDVVDEMSFNYCQRLINEALLELDHHGMGPVHIDVPSYGRLVDVSVPELPKTRAIFRHDLEDDWSMYAQKIIEKKVLVLCGQGLYDEEAINQLQIFVNKTGCALAGEHMSNIHLDRYLNINPIISNYSRAVMKIYAPDIMITLGRHTQFDWCAWDHIGIEHWLVSESGRVVDSFNCLTDIFEAKIGSFLKKMNNNIPDTKTKFEYADLIYSLKADVKIPDVKMSHVYAIGKFCEKIPENSILHLSIFNSIRITQYYDLPKSVRVYANLGALGIDGSMSTFIGQAAAFDGLAYLVIGDLSFFYDMNSLMIRHISPNVRILLLNNFGGAEFYQNNGWYDTLDLHTAAKHDRNAKGWVESNNMRYLSAANMDEYLEQLNVFTRGGGDKPIVLEVFNELNNDNEALKQLYAANKKSAVTDYIKDAAKSMLGPKGIDAYKKIRSKL